MHLIWSIPKTAEPPSAKAFNLNESTFFQPHLDFGSHSRHFKWIRDIVYVGPEIGLVADCLRLSRLHHLPPLWAQGCEIYYSRIGTKTPGPSRIFFYITAWRKWSEEHIKNLEMAALNASAAT